MPLAKTGAAIPPSSDARFCSGNVQVATFTMAVDTRRKMVDRGRLFRHKKDPSGNQRPAEWIFTVKSIFLSAGDNEAVEILDFISVNIHGILYTDREGLRDTSIAVRGGRLHIAYDDIHQFAKQMKKLSPAPPTLSKTWESEQITFTDVVEELDRPGSREASIVRAVSDSKEFVGSILQSVQEIQWAMTFVRFSKVVDSLPQAPSPLVLNVVTHEIGIDLHRVDSNSPAHRMYFSRGDVAHQALVAAISISASLDEAENAPNKIMYIPMATTTIRTTLPSKTMTFTEERDVSERNANVLFANLVVTSPSIDLEPRHLAQLLAIQQKRKAKSTSPGSNHRLISRLLPRASVKFSIHEPVVRFVLPVAHPTNSQPDDFDMIISAISSISLEIESSHSDTSDLRYSLASNFRVSSHHLYYQAASGIKHNLVVMEALEMKLQLSATTQVHVILSGNLRSFSILMVREEVSTGVYNIVRHFKRNVKPDKLPAPADPRFHSFLRKLPSRFECHLEGSDCSIEIRGIDKTISKQTRGIALQLESWTAHYLSLKDGTMSVNLHAEGRAYHVSRPWMSDKRRLHESILKILLMAGDWQFTFVASRALLSRHWIAGNITLSFPYLDSKSLRAHLVTCKGPSSMSTQEREHGTWIFHSIGITLLGWDMIFKDAFMGPVSDKVTSPSIRRDRTHLDGARNKYVPQETWFPGAKLVTVDVKGGTGTSQGYDAIRSAYPAASLRGHRRDRSPWSAPFLRLHLIRLHAEAPRLRLPWACLASVNNVCVDIRHRKKKTATWICR